MAQRRVFVSSVLDRAASVEGPRARHLARVVRLRPGEQVEISDGQTLHLAKVAAAAESRVEFEILGELPAPEPGPAVTLQVAIFKFPRLEWLIEKATELGVESIVPVAAELSEKGLVQAAGKRVERWRRIAEEAALQSRRMAPPQIHEPLSFDELVANPTQAGCKLVLDTEAPPLAEQVGKQAAVPGQQPRASLLVGPEGGWTGRERRAAVEAGYTSVGLGPLVLRAETAAIAGLAILMHLLRRRSHDVGARHAVPSVDFRPRLSRAVQADRAKPATAARTGVRAQAGAPRKSKRQSPPSGAEQR
jgi:16S rRNA (uracil1498-N3)-methyltransferase